MLFIQAASARFSLGLAGGFFLYLLINLGGAWSWGSKTTPLGLTKIIGELAAQQASNWGLVLLTTGLAIAIFYLLATWIYQRKELAI